MRPFRGFSLVWPLVCALVIVVALGGWYVFTPPALDPVVCTADATQCPDGSYVGRSGPMCEFAACPSATTTPPVGNGGGGIAPYTSGIRGLVMLGPTCPVMRDPPDPQCSDKPYATLVRVYRAGNTQPFATMKSGADGTFTFSLPPGEYSVAASGGTTLPRCNITPVTVEPKGYTNIVVSCDTGIR